MTEEEARAALFKVHYEYMMNTPKKRLELYDEYIKKRSEIKKALIASINEKNKNNTK